MLLASSECHQSLSELSAEVPFLRGIERLLKTDEDAFHAFEFGDGLLLQIVVEADCRLLPRIPCAEDCVLGEVGKGFSLNVEHETVLEEDFLKNILMVESHQKRCFLLPDVGIKGLQVLLISLLWIWHELGSGKARLGEFVDLETWAIGGILLRGDSGQPLFGIAVRRICHFVQLRDNPFVPLNGNVRYSAIALFVCGSTLVDDLWNLHENEGARPRHFSR